MTTVRFEAGDKVRFGEVEGVLRESSVGLKLDHQSGPGMAFTSNGELLYVKHFGCVLTLIEKAKKKVRVERWVNIYSEEMEVWTSKKLADEFGGKKRIACVPFVYDSEEEHIQISKKDLARAVIDCLSLRGQVGRENTINDLWRVLKEGKG